jgi:DNA polymerase
MSKKESMKQIFSELEALTNSPLYKYRKENNYKPVLGEGNLNSNVMLVGEAPGKYEAESGRPFCGRAGKVLDEFLKTANVERSDIYITNIVKDRPPNNRRPTKKEVKIYKPLLIREIKIIEPHLVVSLGKTSTQSLFDFFNIERDLSPFAEVEGEIFQQKIEDNPIRIVPLYHPAYAIYRRDMRPHMQEEFEKVLSF